MEQYPVWFDMTHCIPQTRFRNVFSLEWCVFRDISGKIVNKWRIDKRFVYDDNQVSTHTKNVVLDSMIEMLH
jgi:hypothetical protein